MTTSQLDVKQVGEQVKLASEPFRQLLQEMHRVVVGQEDLLISDIEPGRLLERLESFRPQVNLAERWAKQAGGAEERG